MGIKEEKRQDKEDDNNEHYCLLSPRDLLGRIVASFVECLGLHHSSAPNTQKQTLTYAEEEEEEEALEVETPSSSLKVVAKRSEKQPVSSGKPGGINNYIQ